MNILPNIEPAFKHDTFDMIAATMARVEAAMLERIEKIEGSLPSLEEVLQHTHRMIHQDGSTDWLWRGKIILRQSGLELGEKTMSMVVRID